MPIFWLTRLVNGSGRRRGSWPWQKASIEIAASWPWATAVMMFFGPERGVAAEEDVRQARLEGDGVDGGQAVAVERDARVALDPGKGVFLADRDQDVVAFDHNVRFAGRDEQAAPALVLFRRHLLEHDAGQAAPLRG